MLLSLKIIDRDRQPAWSCRLLAVRPAVRNVRRSAARRAGAGRRSRHSAFEYREAGEFTRGGRRRRRARCFSAQGKAAHVMMRRQVTAAEYEECVREGGCPPAPQDNAPDASGRS